MVLNIVYNKACFISW